MLDDLEKKFRNYVKHMNFRTSSGKFDYRKLAFHLFNQLDLFYKEWESRFKCPMCGSNDTWESIDEYWCNACKLNVLKDDIFERYALDNYEKKEV